MMNCYCTSQFNNDSDNCCHANELCKFSGDLSEVNVTPIYVQSVYDAVRFNMHGMRTVQNLHFSPCIPCGCTVTGINDIRIKRVFDPVNSGDCNNLTLEMETGITGAHFVNNSCGVVETIGPDGVPSEKMLYADSNECDSSGSGTPIFGTQNAKLYGNVMIYLDITLCDACGRETCATLSAELNIAKQNCPLVLSNFFELCMPNIENSAFLPRLTELANVGFNARLATNSVNRDICIGHNGDVTANLIITLCVAAEKKITVPVQLCVLSTGFANAPLKDNNFGNMSCPGLFPERTERTEKSDCLCNEYPPVTCC
ncbi:MAG: hypothetical protein Q4B18_03730 [Bacillota bacterium]|nr:hypothetical protein [Bacillota bacterium]